MIRADITLALVIWPVLLLLVQANMAGPKVQLVGSWELYPIPLGFLWPTVSPCNRWLAGHVDSSDKFYIADLQQGRIQAPQYLQGKFLTFSPCGGKLYYALHHSTRGPSLYCRDLERGQDVVLFQCLQPGEVLHSGPHFYFSFEANKVLVELELKGDSEFLDVLDILRCYALDTGKVCWELPVQQLFSKHLGKFFHCSMLAFSQTGRYVACLYENAHRKCLVVVLDNQSGKVLACHTEEAVCERLRAAAKKYLQSARALAGITLAQYRIEMHVLDEIQGKRLLAYLSLDAGPHSILACLDLITAEVIWLRAFINETSGALNTLSICLQKGLLIGCWRNSTKDATTRFTVRSILMRSGEVSAAKQLDLPPDKYFQERLLVWEESNKVCVFVKRGDGPGAGQVFVCTLSLPGLEQERLLVAPNCGDLLGTQKTSYGREAMISCENALFYYDPVQNSVRYMISPLRERPLKGNIRMLDIEEGGRRLRMIGVNVAGEYCCWDFETDGAKNVIRCRPITDFPQGHELYHSRQEGSEFFVVTPDHRTVFTCAYQPNGGSSVQVIAIDLQEGRVKDRLPVDGNVQNLLLTPKSGDLLVAFASNKILRVKTPLHAHQPEIYMSLKRRDHISAMNISPDERFLYLIVSQKRHVIGDDFMEIEPLFVAYDYKTKERLFEIPLQEITTSVLEVQPVIGRNGMVLYGITGYWSIYRFVNKPGKRPMPERTFILYPIWETIAPASKEEAWFVAGFRKNARFCAAYEGSIGKIQILRLDDEKPSCVARWSSGHEGNINCVEISDNCKYVATWGTEGILKLWKVELTE